MRHKTLSARVDSFRLSLTAGDIPTLVYDRGGLVGLAGSGPARDVGAPVGLELRWIYTLAGVHGGGIGQQLLDAVIGNEGASL